LHRKILGVIFAMPRTDYEASVMIGDAATAVNAFVVTALMVGKCPDGHPAEYAETEGDHKYYYTGCNSPGCDHHGRWNYSLETMTEDIDTNEATALQFSAWRRG